MIDDLGLMHSPILGTRQLQWRDEDDCAAFARALAVRPEIRNAFIELRGALGAGKTTFVRHLLRALGATGRIKSPTYAVMEPYELPSLQAWHFDFYRFDDPREWEDAGLRDIFAGPGLKLAEWPEQVGDLLPAPDLRMELLVGDRDERHVTLTALTPAGAALLP
ncbi:tRNA (adenosine(37)-N6)-threonylcarbamoyltransferase complex ATPase subunit type 1 TsaE [Caldimonas thermodepolymerans]|jgi:ATPase, YjeE family|uniref:tRNA threonylcarbamoyladenosine biosynthesis protein TsaE n=2 Tax=Caldimonas thermodepolymerans TaxID=215580 RepID=A0AA46HXG9_9BURK|nr:tRNA (adenosine(37)-N6)-threonylcarbamoyltransferase complex ATPase subunit type 1 TsaE [Caldimonas thermodepolymerans]RDI03637.1 tRNA threonylcarbamoyladenosine biosynthesis protein TsaE [Caldimonas thermodepolymerans]TCP09606.1 tRNA threonylcarbamoyladenosine biosynthesis protein TsaE [Caldimonas thermodepolymerans]UZG45730.1 tRNA (adenosine(37)-N6)-threonylcarbamoyltransferase complex ATPase subunit type 1 TsaE [Caldimonas thermodepolymerans]UZG49623.1 tRNA (adenosine(37)-N6)-threonylcarb